MERTLKIMTQITRTVLEKYQVRKNKKQKSEFIAFASEKAESLGYEVNIEDGTFGAKNIVVGDPAKAKAVFTAHYDTCARLPFPNFITPKNFLIYLLYQILITVVFFFIPLYVICFGAGAVMGYIGVPEVIFDDLIMLIYYAALIVFLALLVAGPANKHTANDNTSGVTTLFEIMEAMPNEQKRDVAFIFFDLEEMGLFGSASYASKHKCVKKNALVINFDCVSDGENILFALKKDAKKYEDALRAAFDDSGSDKVKVKVESKGVFYPSDQINFKHGVGVAALKTSKRFGVLYMDRIHTKKDVIYREENIEFLAAGAVKLIERLGAEV